MSLSLSEFFIKPRNVSEILENISNADFSVYIFPTPNFRFTMCRIPGTLKNTDFVRLGTLLKHRDDNGNGMGWGWGVGVSKFLRLMDSLDVT